MQSNISKNIEKIYSEFSKLSKYPKALIKYGSQAFLALFALGTLLVVLNHTALNYDAYFEFIAESIIKSSFTILAEAYIGALIIDYVMRKP